MEVLASGASLNTMEGDGLLSGVPSIHTPWNYARVYMAVDHVTVKFSLLNEHPMEEVFGTATE